MFDSEKSLETHSTAAELTGGVLACVGFEISRHGVTADLIYTARDTFDSPSRRSTKVSALRDPAAAGRHEEHLHQERVAVGEKALQRQRRDRRTSPAPIARRAVAGAQLRYGADVGVGHTAENPPAEPVDDRAAWHVARSDDELGARRWPQSGRQLPGSCEKSASISRTHVHRLGEIAFFMPSTRSPESASVPCDASPPGVRVLTMPARPRPARAVRRLIVDDDRRTASCRISPGHEHGEVCALVVGRHHDERRENSRAWPLPRSDALCSETRPINSIDDAQEDEQHRGVGDVRLRGDRCSCLGTTGANTEGGHVDRERRFQRAEDGDYFQQDEKNRAPSAPRRIFEAPGVERPDRHEHTLYPA